MSMKTDRICQSCNQPFKAGLFDDQNLCRNCSLVGVVCIAPPTPNPNPNPNLPKPQVISAFEFHRKSCPQCATNPQNLCRQGYALLFAEIESSEEKTLTPAGASSPDHPPALTHGVVAPSCIAEPSSTACGGPFHIIP